MRPNQAEAINVDLHTHDYTFRKGHKIMVQVQSSWFPLIDRNPQKFVPNIFLARREDFRAATHRIYRSPKAASHIELPVAVR
jgi:predicted acyl esterase